MLRFTRMAGIALLTSVPVVSACQSGAGEMAYVERLGADTMAVEVFTATDDRIDGKILMRSPVTRVATYTAHLSSAGTISHLTVHVTTPPENPGGPPPQHIEVTVGDDEAVSIVNRGETTDTVRAEVAAGVIPSVGRIPLPVAFVQHAVRQAAASGQDSTAIAFLGAGGHRVQPNYVKRTGADFQYGFFGMPVFGQVDADGRVVSISGRLTTMQVETERVPSVPFEALAADFAGRDARGAGVGVPSPTDTVAVTGGRGARFEIVYGRPATRGRTIWGGLVPFDTIWRTGANAATHFTTDRDLMIRNVRVPRGSYTLWSTYNARGGTLVINRQTGIWGTAYDSTHNLARIPLDEAELAEPVERFTMAIDPTPDGGVLTLAWDRTQYSVPLAVRR